MISDSKFDFLAQLNHMLFGALIVLGPTAIMGPAHLWWFVGGTVVATAVKEFWYDQHYEGVDERGSNMRDFLFYQLGMAMALGAYFLFRA